MLDSQRINFAGRSYTIILSGKHETIVAKFGDNICTWITNSRQNGCAVCSNTVFQTLFNGGCLGWSSI